MPIDNTRIVVRGVPKSDRAADVVVVTREEAQRLAKQFAVDAKATEAELKKLLHGRAPARPRRRL